MPGTYTQEELTKMSPEEFAAAHANGFTRGEVNLGSSVPQPKKDVWAQRAAGGVGQDFTCPSGQVCRLRDLDVDRLLEAGILDKVSRLEGLAENLVQQAEGAPPAATKLPTREEWAVLLETINQIVSLAVAEPYVYADPEPGTERTPGLIYVSDIDLNDRIAIMDESLKKVRALDRFRHAR